MRSFFSAARKVVIGFSLMGLATVALPHVSAQQNNAVRGGITGVVTDTTGAVVPGAKVTLSGPQTTVVVTSDSKGLYVATGLTLGSYKVTATAPGFSTYESTGNEVTIDHTGNLDIKLAVGVESQTVEVQGGVTAIDLQNESVNTAITDTFYEAMPLPRNVSGAFYTAPGVVSGGGTGNSNPSIGGSSGLENLYTADGVTITDQAYGGLGVYTPSHGSLGTGINLTFVKEVDIKTGAFEPKYGQGDGGIIEIVTKSGSNGYHGAINAYVTPQKGFASAFQPYMFQNANPATPLSSIYSAPQYELSGEFGGYIVKDKLFFFGAFDPTLSRNIVGANPKSPLTGDTFTESQTSKNWAGKLTYLPLASTVVEASSYGDPSKENSVPFSTAATSVPSVSSSWGFGTRNSIFRVNTAASRWLNLFGAFAYNHADFNESPTLPNEPGISDRRSSTYINYGLGQYYTTRDNSYMLQGEAQANANFLGKHTIMAGYLYDHVDFEENTIRSGPGYTIPTTNAAGRTLTQLFSNIPAGATGQHSNATYRLFTTTGCTYCATDAQGRQVYFQSYRATYSPTNVSAVARYHTAYGNETYQPERHVTINAGVRWEQQAYGGSLLTYHWQDNWSPRLSAAIDPLGDRKSKIFFSYSRYQAPLPLDAAIRQLGSEQDDTTFYFAPVSSGGVAVPDATGALVPNTTVALNGTAKSATANFGAPSFSSSTGEGILPGTRMEYTNEYILGVDHEIKPGMVASVRYTDRQFGRIVEDIGSQSPEGSEVDANYAGGIANVNAGTDIATNEVEVVYTPAQFAAANGGRTPGQVTAANYVAPVAGCTYGTDTSVANGAFFQHFDGTQYNGACVTNAPSAGAYGADGKPDGFADPRRHYQALEVELNRSLHNHWQAKINYRYAKLYGNYEGFFRNDNGQSDPGISSLFDFTQGSLGLLGDQFKRGFLPSDRRNVANVLVAYTLGKDTPYLGRLSGLTVGTWLHALSGNPLSAFQSHPIYGNVGEVPVGGRGTIGTTAVDLQLDLHAEDAFHVGDRFVIRAGFDAFNATNTQPITQINQNLDTAPLTAGGVKNPDYNTPIAFQQAFHARFKLGFEF